MITVKNDEKHGEELTCRFKIYMRNLTNFDPGTQKTQSLQFNGLLLPKKYNIWANKVQRIFV